SQAADFHRFAGRHGRTLYLSLITYDFQSRVYLRDPFGKLLCESATATWNLPETGIYTIEVTCASRYESGVYTINADYGCDPAFILEVWADGVRVPPGGTIDFGSDTSKQITITNLGNAMFVF